jgi:flavin reductase (DIM6/NTAB) family NADH-FMN oxidoreductase RutF
MPVDGAEFRDAAAHVATAVSVVTTLDRHGLPRGMTIGSLCSLSLDPPLVLFCVDRRAGAHSALCGADRFAVNVLAAHQQETASRFAGPADDRFSYPLPFTDGLPVVPDSLATLVCSLHSLADGGDHTIVIARVERTRVSHGRPLVYYGRGFHRLASDNTATPSPMRLSTTPTHAVDA